jgi:aerobic carbon-monoxide dehydrogenase small subunit
MTIRFTVDKQPATIDNCPADATLLDVLRTVLGKTGTRAGCRNGDCGACTVLIDDEAFKSCVVPGWRVEDCNVETIEGLVTDDGRLHHVQKSFRDEVGFQCGFCLAGPILCLVALLRADPAPSDESVADSLAGNLCRCTGYQQIMRAARAAVAAGDVDHEDTRQRPAGESRTSCAQP